MSVENGVSPPTKPQRGEMCNDVVLIQLAALVLDQPRI